MFLNRVCIYHIVIQFELKNGTALKKDDANYHPTVICNFSVEFPAFGKGRFHLFWQGGIDYDAIGSHQAMSGGSRC